MGVCHVVISYSYVFCPILQNSSWFATIALLLLSIWNFCLSYFYYRQLRNKIRNKTENNRVTELKNKNDETASLSDHDNDDDKKRII